MSAVSDSQQGISFIYTNFYDHYKNLSSARGVVLKTESVPTLAEVSVVTSEQQQDLSSWVHQTKSEGKKDLALHLRELREARKRFTYLLAEVEDLLKRE